MPDLSLALESHQHPACRVEDLIPITRYIQKDVNVPRILYETSGRFVRRTHREV